MQTMRYKLDATTKWVNKFYPFFYGVDILWLKVMLTQPFADVDGFSSKD
jgi:hypothetical protein